jgi:hypothetical protein
MVRGEAMEGGVLKIIKSCENSVKIRHIIKSRKLKVYKRKITKSKSALHRYNVIKAASVV